MLVRAKIVYLFDATNISLLENDSTEEGLALIGDVSADFR